MTRREIGSEFELAPTSQGTAAPFGWLHRPSTTHLASGREALRLLLRHLAAQGRSRLVLPAYLCESVEQAALGAGDWVVSYVDVGPELQPQAGPLRDALATEPAATAYVEVQVFATPTLPDVRAVLTDAERQGVAIIEDRTHNALSAPEPTRPLALASLRKWFSLPDGAVAVGTDLTPDPSEPAFVALRGGALSAKWRFLTAGEGDKPSFLAGIAQGERALDTNRAARAMSPSSRALLDAADIAAIAAARRANHDHLRARIDRDALRGVLRPLEAPLDALSPGAVPLGLPVLSPCRDLLRRFLIEHDVYCPVHWPLPPAVDEERFPVAHARNRELMTLVIDQRYGPSDMDRVATLVERFAKETP